MISENSRGTITAEALQHLSWERYLGLEKNVMSPALASKREATPDISNSLDSGVTDAPNNAATSDNLMVAE